MTTPAPGSLELRQLPDSPDARLFVELASYAADLTEARAALELALASIPEENPPSDPHTFLIGYAAIAYCRTYFPSKVRTSMIDRVQIPAEHAELHAQITDYRNRRVAHSQSHLSSTFAFVGLDANGVRPGLLTVTASQEIPASFFGRWISLIDALTDGIDEMQAEVEARILETIAKTEISDVRAWRPMPDLEEQLDSRFTARPSRGRYPTRWTTFWSRVD